MNRLIDWIWKAFFYLGIQVADRIPRKKEKSVPASPGLRPQEGYIEPRRTFELREAYVVRRATREEILASEDHLRAQALIRDAGGC